MIILGIDPGLARVGYGVIEMESERGDIGFVQVGRPADISIDSFPATDFGVLLGTVKGIGSDALPPDVRQHQAAQGDLPAAAAGGVQEEDRFT